MTDKAGYERHKGAAAKRQAEQSLEGRDIGSCPPAKNPKRKAAARRDFRTFCLRYFPWLFSMPFCPDHLKVIAKIETSVLKGGLFAVAMPRGAGKTTLCESACLWALLYGHRSFVVLIGADEGAAARMLESIKVELETNELLAGDFGEVCYPIARLERIANRCKGQLSNKRPTHIIWTADTVALPTIRRSAASGGVVMIGGLTASIRGLKFKRADGRAARPDLVIIDDPQTDDSARSASQCAYRERIVAGAILGMAGPGKKIAGIMPCTVVVQNDMADRLLDKAKHPEWRGERTKLIYSLPANERLWEEYAELRRESLRQELGGAAATEFYRANREEMDRGASPAWPERFEPDELSAVQHAMNIKIDRPEIWDAEYQNDPPPLVAVDARVLTADQIAAKVNRHAKGVVPGGLTRLTAGVDLQQDLLYWCVCGWADDFTGSVVAYGTFPEQGLAYFSAKDARPTLAHAVGIASLEGSLFAGLTRLADQVLGREWPLDGGGGLRVERALVDANWGQSTDAVYRWCRQSPHAALVTPSHGKGIGASGAPMEDWQRRPGERRGHNWVQPPPKPGRVRHVLFDANQWKSFVHARLAQPAGERGSLSLFGERSAEHRLFAAHLTAETPVRTSGNNRELDEWRLRPERPDNHWFDCVVLAAVAASMLGCQLASLGPAKAERKKVSYAELQRQAKERRR
jgi:hypothetical protein